MPQLVSSVKNGFTDRKNSLSGDAHNQEGFEAEKNILQGIEEVRKHDDVESVVDVLRIVHKHETKKHDITACKSHQALVECRFHFGIFKDKNC